MGWLSRTAIAAGLCVSLMCAMQAPALAADICTAVALRAVPDWGDGYPQDASGSVLKKGEIDDAITQYRVNKKTGDSVFCSHGGYCYPRYLTINGQKVEALRLTNCKVGAREPGIPGIVEDDVTYDVDVDRSKNSASNLMYDDLDNALLTLGMCSACASDAADIYLKHPQLRCGATVASALEGDKKAIAELQSNPDYCDEAPLATASAPRATVPKRRAPSIPTSPAAPRNHINLLEVALVIAGLLYFVPSLIAFLRHKRQAPAILALNVFLGWTFLGWVGSLVWSLLRDAPPP
jgi:Superinfection immunity protein